MKHISSVVLNEDHSPLSRRLLSALEQSEYFDMNYTVSSEKEMAKLFDLGAAFNSVVGFYFSA